MCVCVCARVSLKMCMPDSAITLPGHPERDSWGPKAWRQQDWFCCCRVSKADRARPCARTSALQAVKPIEQCLHTRHCCSSYERHEHARIQEAA